MTNPTARSPVRTPHGRLFPEGRWGLPSLLAACLLTLAACGGESTFEITEVREVPASEASPTAGSPHGDTARQPEWRYDTPPGWTLLPEAPMRILGFRVGEGEDTTCTFSILSGSGVGTLANVNRWRRQMSLEPITAEALAKLKPRIFLQRRGVEVDLEGDYVGMGHGEDVAGARLVGWIVEEGGAAAFLKLVGPADVVAGELENLDRFASSLRLEMPQAPEQDLPAGHPPVGDTPATAPAPPTRSRLAWDDPEGWTKLPARRMREVTFAPPGATKTEMAVSILSGTGGGLAMNLNRWREQMGQPPLSEDEIAALPRVPSLGREGTLIEIEGHYRGMGSDDLPAAALLGFVVMRDGDAVFVKMWGPSDEVLPHRAAFETFCRSLRE